MRISMIREMYRNKRTPIAAVARRFHALINRTTVSVRESQNKRFDIVEPHPKPDWGLLIDSENLRASEK